MWDRKTLQLHRSFRGHEGPVNAVGVQGGRLASASGDGKMILWDIASGERLRTFEAHDRGLACIEFKVCHAPFTYCTILMLQIRVISSFPVLTTARSKFGMHLPGNVCVLLPDMTLWFVPCPLSLLVVVSSVAATIVRSKSGM